MIQSDPWFSPGSPDHPCPCSRPSLIDPPLPAPHQPALPGYGFGRVLGLLALGILVILALDAASLTLARGCLGGDATLPRWFSGSLANLVLLGVALQGLRGLGQPWRQIVAAAPEGHGWREALLLAGWLGLLVLELNLLPWCLARWPGLHETLPTFTYPYAFAPVVLLAPIAEEAFFRGVVCEGLARRYGDATGILGSALLFAVVHASWLVMPGALVFGVLMGLYQRRTGSILACIAIHCANNALASWTL